LKEWDNLFSYWEKPQRLGQPQGIASTKSTEHDGLM